MTSGDDVKIIEGVIQSYLDGLTRAMPARLRARFIQPAR